MKSADSVEETAQPQWRCGARCREYQQRSGERIESCRHGPETCMDFDLPVYLTESALEASTLEEKDDLIPVCLPRLRPGESSSWAEWLRGRSITLCPVATRESRTHLHSWGRRIRPLVRALRWMEIPDLMPYVSPDGGDFNDLDSDQLAALQLTAAAWEPDLAIDADALLAQPLVPWLVEGILPIGLTVVTGRPGAGTTSLALQLSLLVATGTAPAGSGAVKAGRVLYCTLEEPVDLLRPLLQFALGDEPLPAGITFRPALPALDEGGIAALRAWAQTHSDGRLIVIDGYERIAPRRADLGVDALAVLNGLAAELGIAILAVRRVAHLPRAHHPASAPNHLILQTEGTRRAHLEGRTVRGFVDFPLIWDQVQRRWAVSEIGPVALGSSRQAIWNLLAARGPMTPAEISEALGQARGTTRSLLSRMTHDGQLIAEDGRYHRGIAAE